MAKLSLITGNKNYSSWSLRLADLRGGSAAGLPRLRRCRMRALPATREWIAAANRETAFIAGEEPYATEAASPPPSAA